jgi:hypothetical protein
MVEYRKARRLAKSSQDAPSRISIPTIPSEPASVGIVSILPIGDKRFWILSASGTISIVSDTNEIVATETHADGVIKCACIVGDSVWFGVETQIYKASCHDRKIVISLVLDLGAMSTTDVAHLVCVSTTREVWASTSGGNLCVLDALSSKKKEEFSADTHVFSMCVVDMSEVQTVWLGLRDQINVFDCHSRSLRSILPSPCRGVVVSMVPVSYGVVWSGIKNENTGSLVVWNFCQ